MKLILCIVIYYIFLLPAIVVGQDLSTDMSYGIGIITFNNTLHPTKSIDLYNEDFSLFNSFQPKNSLNDTTQFSFLALNSETGYIEIRCIKETDNHYYVVTNENIRTVHIINKSDLFKLEYWEEYILNSSTICQRNEIFDSINSSVKLRPENDILKPAKIEGEWLMLQWDANFNKFDTLEDIQNGWVRWKKNDSVLIKVIYLR